MKALPIVTGATVNTATGKEATGILRADKYGVEVESMEGAGALKFGEDFGIPVLQIRSISNIATTRNRDSWDIVGAIKSLREFVWCCIMKLKIGISPCPNDTFIFPCSLEII